MTGTRAMEERQRESRPHDGAGAGAEAKPVEQAKARDQSEQDAVARAVLEALSAHDSM